MLPETVVVSLFPLTTHGICSLYLHLSVLVILEVHHTVKSVWYSWVYNNVEYNWECCSAPLCNWSTGYHIRHDFSILLIQFLYVLHLASSPTVKSCSREGRAYEGCRHICWFSEGNERAGDRCELLIVVHRKEFVMILPLVQLAADNTNNFMLILPLTPNPCLGYICFSKCVRNYKIACCKVQTENIILLWYVNCKQILCKICLHLW